MWIYWSIPSGGETAEPPVEGAEPPPEGEVGAEQPPLEAEQPPPPEPEVEDLGPYVEPEDTPLLIEGTQPTRLKFDC